MSLILNFFVFHCDFQINGVRMAINFAIGSESAVASWGPDAVYKIQDKARRKLMESVKFCGLFFNFFFSDTLLLL